jgi:hypothetical protein
LFDGNNMLKIPRTPFAVSYALFLDRDVCDLELSGRKEKEE